MGCVVNGPGEAREADIGLTGGTPNNMIFLGGRPHQKINNEQLLDGLESLIREKAAARQLELDREQATLIARQ